MAAPTLSADQQRRTLKASSQKKSIVRATLATPYKTSWPRLNKDVETSVLETLKSTIGPLNVGRLGEIKYPEDVTTKNDRQKYKQKKNQEYWKSGCDNRSSIVLGINAVTRALEKDQLAAALLCSDVTPEAMTQFLIPLCATRQVAAMAIRGFGTTLRDLLHLKSCRAMGLKRDVQDASHLLHPLYKKITSSAVPLANALVEVSTNLELLLDTSVKQTSVTKPSKREKQLASDSDYDHLYVYKSNEDKRKPLVKKAPGFIALPSEPDVELAQDSATLNISFRKSKEKSIEQKHQKLKYHNLNLKRVHLSVKNKKRKRPKPSS